MKCPHCQMEIDNKLIAKELGKIGGQKPKNYTDEEKDRRRARLAIVRHKWGAKATRSQLSQIKDPRWYLNKPE